MTSILKVNVERYVEQVYDGVQYKGRIVIGGVEFEYRLVFNTRIPDIAKNPAKSEDDVYKICRIELKKGDYYLSLEDKDLWWFFFQALVIFAVQFHDSPQTRDAQEGIIGMAVLGHTRYLPDDDFAGGPRSAKIGMSKNETVELSPSLRRKFSAPEFGCVFES